MKYGLTDDQYQFVLDQVVKPLKKYDAQVYCFGSRARGDHQPYSDLDLMVESDKAVPIERLSQIIDSMTESNFPYKVDLVRRSDFAESYIKSYLQDRRLF